MDGKTEDLVINFNPGDNYQNIVLKSDIPVIIDFYADWCDPCFKLETVLKEKLKIKKFKLVKIDVDCCPDETENFSISGLPYIVLIKNGKTLAEFSGFDLNSLDNMLKLI
jgi:thioredoxin 1